MSLMLRLPIILFLGPSTTGRPPISLFFIFSNASRISSSPRMLMTWTMFYLQKQERFSPNIQIKNLLYVVVIGVLTSSADMKGSPKSDIGDAEMQSNQSLPRHFSRPCTTADCVMKLLMFDFPDSITGTFLSLYLDSNNKTLNIELSVATGTNGAQR